MGTWEDRYIMAAVSMPIYWFLVMMPHIARALKGLGDKQLSQINGEPRQHFEAVSKDENNPNAGFIRRAGACHQNGWENFTVFVSAALAGAIGGIDPAFYNTCCLIVLIARFFYNICYLLIESGPLSLLRTGCFMIANGAVLALWIKGAIELAK